MTRARRRHRGPTTSSSTTPRPASTRSCGPPTSSVGTSGSPRTCCARPWCSSPGSGTGCARSSPTCSCVACCTAMRSPRGATARPRGRRPPRSGSEPDEPWDAEVVERRREVLRALDALTPRQRAVVVLRWFEERGEREVADVLGCSVGTAHAEGIEALAGCAPRCPAPTSEPGACDERRPARAAGAGQRRRPRARPRSGGLGGGPATEPAGRATHRARRRVVWPRPGRWASSCGTGARHRPEHRAPRRRRWRRTAGCRPHSVEGVTVYLAPDPPDEALLPRYPDAARLKIPRHLGPADPAIRAELGPGGGVDRAAACGVPRRRRGGWLPPGALRAGRAVPGRGTRIAGQPGGGRGEVGARPAVDLRRPAQGRHPAARTSRGARRARRHGRHDRGARPHAVDGRLGPRSHDGRGSRAGRRVARSTPAPTRCAPRPVR